MPKAWSRVGAGLLLLSLSTHVTAADNAGRIQQRVNLLLGSVHTLDAMALGRHLDIQTHSCSAYPYAEQKAGQDGRRPLLMDLQQGLKTGLSCLAGYGPMGELHPYHRLQAGRIASLLTNGTAKNLRCVNDEMFANAVATTPVAVDPEDILYAQLRQVEHPGIVFDLYRLGGLLSRKHDRNTYRDFFLMDERQIEQHLTAHPLHLDGLHRHDQLPALIFHEMVHWLGHTHSRDNPDLAHLYETCCFGGSSYISDAGANRDFQLRACQILRDQELWEQPHNQYRQMRLWRYKEYDQLKVDMRAEYD